MTWPQRQANTWQYGRQVVVQMLAWQGDWVVGMLTWQGDWDVRMVTWQGD
jgi:hypothetical protein